MSVRGYGRDGQRPTWLPPGTSSTRALTPPSTPLYRGPADSAAEEWWLGVPAPAEFRVNTGDQGTFTTAVTRLAPFTDHSIGATPPVVRASTSGESSTGATTVAVTWPAGAAAGDLAVLVVSSRTWCSPPTSGWTVPLRFGDATDGFGFVAWRILTAADITTGGASYATGGADPEFYTPDSTWLVSVVAAGTFDPDAPVLGSSGIIPPDSAYTVAPLVAPGWVEGCLSLGVLTMTAYAAVDVEATYGDVTYGAVLADTPAYWGTVIEESPAVSGHTARFERFGDVAYTTTTVTQVLIAPTPAAVGALSLGPMLSLTTRRALPLHHASDARVTELDVDLSASVPDPVAADEPATRWTYTAEETGTLTVSAAASAGGDVDLWVTDEAGTVVASSTTGTVSAEVTADTSYRVVAAPAGGDTAQSARLSVQGPRNTQAVPSTWAATDAPVVPVMSPYTGDPVLWRHSPVVPAPSLTDGRPVDWAATSWTRQEWGTLRVVVDGQDVTRFRDVPCQIDRFELMEPFGCGKAQIVFPQIGPWEARSGDLAWLAIGNNVDIVRLHPNGSTRTVLWSGLIPLEGIQAGPGGRSTRIDLIGDMWAGDLQIHKVKPYLPPTDVGKVIADALNTEVVSRRVKKTAAVTTGITCNKRGSADQSVIAYVQELLGIYGTTEDGTDTWTVARTTTARQYELRLKDRTTVACTIRSGAYWDIDLTRDATETPNVIYGHGVNSDGYAWAGWVYPQAANNDYRAYPLSVSPLATITVGTTDADTSTGTGVSDLQERINDLGIRGAQVAVDGVYNASDADDVRVVQDHFGLQIDGIVGPQTWSAIFPQYLTNNLDGCFRLPLSAKRAVVPRLFNADGTDAGENASYDPDALRVEVDRAYESGISKKQARVSARAELARVPSPGLAGTITLTVDPPECSKWDLKEGQNVTVQGIRGSNTTLHVSGVAVSPPKSATDTGTVTLTVDQYARDLVSLAGVLARDAESRQDPVRLPRKKVRRGSLSSDAVVVFDGESAGGIIRRTALIGGLWVYLDVPVSQTGRVAKVTLTTSPATKFTVAFFGDVTVTPEQMIRLASANPLAERKDGFGPYDRIHDEHPELGFIQGIGGPGQAAGYDPGYEDSPYTPGTSTPLTGKLRSTAGWEYQSSRPPFLRVFFWAPSSCAVSGRIWPAPLEA